MSIYSNYIVYLVSRLSLCARLSNVKTLYECSLQHFLVLCYCFYFLTWNSEAQREYWQIIALRHSNHWTLRNQWIVQLFCSIIINSSYCYEIVNAGCFTSWRIASAGEHVSGKASESIIFSMQQTPKLSYYTWILVIILSSWPFQNVGAI